MTGHDENEAYHADTTRVSKSGLDLINKAPALYYARYLDPNRPAEKKTEAFIMGSALHCLTLEEYNFRELFVVSERFSGEGSMRRRDEFAAANQGKEPLSMEQYDTVSRMRDSIMRHPMAADLFKNIIVEQPVEWTDPFTGAKCKCKPDARNTQNGLILDLKTTEDASPTGFARSVWEYRYYVQSPFYFDGCKDAGYNPQQFVFVAVEKTYPYLVGIYFMPERMMNYGRRVYRDDLTTYLECLRTNQWPGYGNIIQPLDFPSWVKI